MKAIICSFIILLALGASAQSDVPAPIELHQIYLDQPADKIIKIKYSDSEEAIKHYLTPDKETIILENYDGLSRVEVTIKYNDGTEESFSKSRCYIDIYVPPL